MGIKIHNSLPPESKRIENFKVFKNELKSYYRTVILCRSFLVTMMDSSLVAQVGFDVVWMLSFCGRTMILRSLYCS
jgi:hypothetical protein